MHTSEVWENSTLVWRDSLRFISGFILERAVRPHGASTVALRPRRAVWDLGL